MDYLQVARDLISIESITGNEEPVSAYLEGVLASMGFEPRSQEVEPGRRNVIAGPEAPRVLFATHVDTVPPYLPFAEDDRYLYGRGACDTKGIIACFLEAGRRLVEAGAAGVGFLFVVGEEVDNRGAKVAHRAVRSPYVIVGEPTENRLAVAHKGVLRVRVSVEGRACHSAYPDAGDSAVHRLLAGLERVLATGFGRHDLLGPATINVGEIHGGVAANVLAPAAEAHIAVRVVTSSAEVEEKLRAAFARPDGAADPRVRIDVLARIEPTFLERLEGFEETVVAYGTDVPYLKAVGRCLLLGPGSILDAHTAAEKIAKDDMARAVDLYVAMARRLLAEGPSAPTT